MPGKNGRKRLLSNTVPGQILKRNPSTTNKLTFLP